MRARNVLVRARMMAVGAALLAVAAMSPGNALAIRCATFWPNMPGVKGIHPLDASARMIRPEDTPYGPPPNPQLGDSWLWYCWHLAGAPYAELKSATIRGVGQHCYVVVEDSQWNVHMFQSDVDRIVQAFDSTSVGPYPTEGSWSLDTGTFGDPPDRLDHDPRIYLFYYQFDVGADGFFWPYDEYPDGTQPYASNECEVVYMDCVQSPPSGDYMLAVMTHEFQHMIHWNYDPDEDAWVNEGCSEYAMWLFGHPDPVTGFASNPDNDLLTFTGTGADYQSSYLYMLYLHERFGGRPMLHTLVAQPTHGTQGIDDALVAAGHPDQNFISVFKDWCVANYIDDPTIGDGRYGYQDVSLPHMSGRRYPNATNPTYPIPPLAMTVNRTAADYLVWTAGAPSLTLGFDRTDTLNMDVYLVQMGGGHASLVTEEPLPPSGVASWSMPGFASWVDSVLMVVEAPRETGGLGHYSVSAAIDATGSVPAGSAAASPLALDVAPNPASGTVRFLASGLTGGDARLSLYTAEGRRLVTLTAAQSAGGRHEFAWDATDAAGAPLPAGVYWARLATGDRTIARKVLITR